MIRIPFFLLASLIALYAAEPRSVTGTLTSATTTSGTVDIGSVPIGVSGIVVHAYDRSHRAIVATAIVQGSEGGRTTVELRPYRGLRQPNLPDVKTPPQKGDTVVLGYLYDRVLPIVPNQKSFDLAHRSFPKLHIVHPDLIAAELAKAKTPIPDREILQKSCDKFNLGLVMIMLADGTDFLDCQSWTKVGHSDIAAVDVTHFKQPFFNRFEEIPSPFYDWSDHTIADYDNFYRKLEQRR